MDGFAKNVTAASIGVRRCTDMAVFKRCQLARGLNEEKVQVGRSFIEIHSLGRENHVFLPAQPRTKVGAWSLVSRFVSLDRYLLLLVATGRKRPEAAVRGKLRFFSSSADTEELSLRNRPGFPYVCFKLVSLLFFLFSQ